MSEFKIGDEVVTVGETWREEYRGLPGVVTGSWITEGDRVEYRVTVSNGEEKLYGGYEDFKLASATSKVPDEVNPDHYSGDLVMRVIEERGLDFSLGNTVKYVCRAGSKGDKVMDLKKARWYLDRAIEKEEGSTE